MYVKVFKGLTVEEFYKLTKGSKGYRKPNYGDKGNYRATIVVDSNKQNELAIVKRVSSSKAVVTKGGNRVRPFIETRDAKSRPIKEGSQFTVKRKKDGTVKETVGIKEANVIKKIAVLDKVQGKENRKLLRELKKRKKTSQ